MTFLFENVLGCELQVFGCVDGIEVILEPDVTRLGSLLLCKQQAKCNLIHKQIYYEKQTKKVKATRTGDQLRLDLTRASFRATANAKACVQLTKTTACY